MFSVNCCRAFSTTSSIDNLKPAIPSVFAPSFFISPATAPRVLLRRRNSVSAQTPIDLVNKCDRTKSVFFLRAAAIHLSSEIEEASQLEPTEWNFRALHVAFRFLFSMFLSLFLGSLVGCFNPINNFNLENIVCPRVPLNCVFSFHVF